jgi:hypothetical protein
MTRGQVADAVIAHMAATLADRYPHRPAYTARADAEALVDELRAAGWRITAPVTAPDRPRKKPPADPSDPAGT